MTGKPYRHLATAQLILWAATTGVFVSAVPPVPNDPWGPPAKPAFPEANPPPPGWAIYYDDRGRMYRCRIFDSVTCWDNPFALAELIVNCQCHELNYMPAPYEHWLPGAAILARASRTADDPDIWGWAVIEAANTRTQCLADIATGRANAYIWPMPSRHQVPL